LPWWQTAVVNDLTRAVVFYFVKNHANFLKISDDSLQSINHMKNLSAKLKIDTDFALGTFYLLYLCRKLFYKPNDLLLQDLIKEKISIYKNTYSHHYKFEIDYAYSFFRVGIFKTIFKITLRRRKKYRLVDYVLFNKISSQIMGEVFTRASNHLPSFVNSIGMPLKTFFS